VKTYTYPEDIPRILRQLEMKGKEEVNQIKDVVPSGERTRVIGRVGMWAIRDKSKVVLAMKIMWEWV
jgi:hypothetical protein